LREIILVAERVYYLAKDAKTAKKKVKKRRSLSVLGDLGERYNNRLEAFP